MTRAQTPFAQAAHRAVRDAMAEDEAVVVIGPNGYGATRPAEELAAEFGVHRVLHAPASEAGLVGVAVGAAMAGLRPLAELPRADRAGQAMDQIANQAARLRYALGGQVGVPLVLRAHADAGAARALEAWCAHVPGLRVAAPASPADAYHLLRDALRQPDPVIVIERDERAVDDEAMDPDASPASWGASRVLREGADVCIVSWSSMVRRALDAAEVLSTEGMEAAVVDLRTLDPLDLSSAVEATARAGRALVVSGGPLTGGFASEVAARLTEEAFDHLEEPILRLAAEDVPASSARALERAAVPDAARIAAAARRLARRGS